MSESKIHSPKKVAIVYGSLQDIHIGAPGHVILDTIRYLPKSEKFEWTVFYYSEKHQQERINGIDVIGVPHNLFDTLVTKVVRLFPHAWKKEFFVTSQLDYIRYLFSIVRNLFFLRPDVVVVHVSYPLPRMVRMILPSAKILYYHHGSTMHTKLSEGQWNKLENSCNGIIAVSQAAFDGVVTTFGPFQCRHWVLYNASPITTKQLSEFKQSRQDIRKHYGFENKTVFVFCGRMVASKGVLQLILAFQKLREEHKEIALLLVGNADAGKHEKDYMSFIQTINSKVIDSNRSIVLTGWIAKDNVASYIASADIAVLPSLAPEGISLFAIDSVALGIPLIVTDTGGNREVVLNEQTGLLISAESGKVELELLSAMKRLLEDKSFYQRCSISSVELSKVKFNMRSMNNSFMQMINKIV